MSNAQMQRRQSRGDGLNRRPRRILVPGVRKMTKRPRRACRRTGNERQRMTSGGGVAEFSRNPGRIKGGRPGRRRRKQQGRLRWPGRWGWDISATGVSPEGQSENHREFKTPREFKKGSKKGKVVHLCLPSPQLEGVKQGSGAGKRGSSDDPVNCC